MLRIVRLLVAGLVGLWLVVEIAAIPLANTAIESVVKSRDHNAATIKASVGTFPILARLVLTGKVNRASAVLQRVAGQRLTFSEIRWDVSGVELDRGDLLRRKFTVEHIDKGTVTATIELSDVAALAGRIGSRATVSGHTLLLGGRSFALGSDLFPCSPDATLDGDRVTLSCTFTQIPDVLLRTQR